MQNVLFIQNLYKKYFPKTFAKTLSNSGSDFNLKNLSVEEKRTISNDFLTKAEALLLKEDFSALKLFSVAAQLDPDNPSVWYRQGISFFEYAAFEKKEHALILAAKNFKIAVTLDSQVFDYWWAWGNVLLMLGEIKNEYHYFIEAKKKYKHAISLAQNQPLEILSEVYWDSALVSMHLADKSGEAIDLKQAIEAFQTSLNYQLSPSSAFWSDFAHAYFNMGFLINDNNAFLQCIECLKNALVSNPKHTSSLCLLAETYSQLYFNTLDEEYFKASDEQFAKALENNPFDENIYYKWAKLHAESGKINKDPKKLRSSIEKCLKGQLRNKKNISLISLWVESMALLGAYTNRLELILEAEHKIIKTSESYSEESAIWTAYGICMRSFAIYYNDTDYEEFALEKFQTALTLSKNSLSIMLNIAESYRDLGVKNENCDLMEKACNLYARAIQFNTSSPFLIFNYAKSLMETAELTYNKVLLQEAVRQFENGLSLQKNALIIHPEWLFNYACCLDFLGTMEEEEELFIKSIDIFNNLLLIDPNHANLHFRLALTLSHLVEYIPDAQYLSKAINCFKIAARQDEENDLIWQEWGLMLIFFAFDHFSYDQQIEYYLEAEQKILRSGQLGNEHAYYHLASLYSLMNRPSDSLAFLEKAKRLDVLPTLEELLEDIWLDNIRSTPEFITLLCELEKKEKIT